MDLGIEILRGFGDRDFVGLDTANIMFGMVSMFSDSDFEGGWGW